MKKYIEYSFKKVRNSSEIEEEKKRKLIFYFCMQFQNHNINNANLSAKTCIWQPCLGTVSRPPPPALLLSLLPVSVVFVTSSRKSFYLGIEILSNLCRCTYGISSCLSSLSFYLVQLCGNDIIIDHVLYNVVEIYFFWMGSTKN